jgi:hypothetical protein
MERCYKIKSPNYKFVAKNDHYNVNFKYVQEPAYKIAKPIYEKSKSLYEFLRSLDESTRSQFLNEWFHRHVYSYKNCRFLLDDNDWIIFADTISHFPEIDYKKV